MTLYNIHTHHLSADNIGGYRIVDILNVYPSVYALESKRSDHCFFSCGIHPWYSFQISDQLELIKKNISDERIVAIGEIGLDKLQGPPLATQIGVFRSQVEIAIDHHKPLIIHCVKCWEQLIAIYKTYQPRQSWIIHGYRGKADQMKQLAQLGFKFSLGWSFNEDTLKQIPLDSLFCETDTLDISILEVYEKIAHSAGISIDLLADIIENNILKTFSIKKL